MKHLMIDLETLGTKPDCVILTVGAIKFDPYTLDEPANGFYAKLDVDQQINLGRSIDQDTIDWWGTQPEKVREEALGDSDRISIEDFFKELNKLLVGIEFLWAQGPTFDFVILENLYRQFKQPIPWNFWQIRDSRTLFSLKPELRVTDANAHNALVDSYIQAISVQKIFKELGLHKKI